MQTRPHRKGIEAMGQTLVANAKCVAGETPDSREMRRFASFKADEYSTPNQQAARSGAWDGSQRQIKEPENKKVVIATDDRVSRKSRTKIRHAAALALVG